MSDVPVNDNCQAKKGARNMTDDDQAAISYQVTRYMRALHGVQSGVKQVMEIGDTGATPKHLRVGVNSALIDSAAIASLLMEKGVFTELEYRTKLADIAEQEIKMYEDKLSDHYGVRFTLE